MKWWKINWKIDPGVIRGMPAGVTIEPHDLANGTLMLRGIPQVAGTYEFPIEIMGAMTMQTVDVGFNPSRPQD